MAFGNAIAIHKLPKTYLGILPPQLQGKHLDLIIDLLGNPEFASLSVEEQSFIIELIGRPAVEILAALDEMSFDLSDFLLDLLTVDDQSFQLDIRDADSGTGPTILTENLRYRVNLRPISEGTTPTILPTTSRMSIDIGRATT